MQAASIKLNYFFICGTHEDPFNRILRVAENLAAHGHIVTIQLGHTPAPKAPSTNLQYFEFCPYNEMAVRIQQSNVVVTHAGTGSIITSLHYGKKPILIPRLKEFGEHIDDHQLQIAVAFKEKGLVYPCFEKETSAISLFCESVKPDQLIANQIALASRMEFYLHEFFKE